MSDEDMRSRHILLVEDEAIVALSEKRVIERHGFTVTAAYSGEDAVERARLDPSIELVLMDIDLGEGMDGTTAAERILEERDLPIVFLTSHAERSYVESVKRITGYGYVLKDSGEFVLIESINMAFDLFEAQQRVAEKEERLSHIIDEAPVGIFQSWSRGGFRHMNAELARILGFADPEAAAAHYTDLARQFYRYPEQRRELLDELERNGAVRNFRFEALRVTGEQISVNVSVFVLGSDEEKGMLISGFLSDETDRTRAEAKLEHSRDEYRSVVELAREIVVRTDTAGRWTFVNGEASRFFSLPRERLLGMRFMDRVHPDDEELTLSTVERVAATLRPVERLVNRQWTAEGWRSVEWNCAPILGADGEYAGLQAIGRDITEQRELQDRLRVSERRHRQLFHSIRDAIIVMDAEGTITDGNRAFSERFGYSKQELRGINVAYLYATSDGSRLMARQLRSPVGTERVFVADYRTKDGAVFPGETDLYRRADDQGRVVELVASIRDITERREKEAALQTKERKWRGLFEQATVGIILANADHAVIDANPQAETLLGYSHQELCAMHAADLIHPEDRADVSPQDNLERMREDCSPLQLERRYRTKQGGYINVLVNMKRLQGMEEEVSHVLMFHDITERKRMQEATRARELRFRTLVENSPDTIFEIDAAGALIYVSPSARELAGADPEALLGTDYRELVHPEDRDRAEAVLRRAVETGEPQESEVRMLRPDGGTRICWHRGAPLFDADGSYTGSMGIVRDITQQKYKEENLRSSEQFLGGVLDALSAHIAVLNEEGTIIAVNEAWRRFARDNDIAWPQFGVGENYIAVAENATGDATEGAQEAADGLREILAGTRERFSLEYPCHSPEEERWFVLRATRFETDYGRRAVVANENVTERKLAERRMERSLEEQRLLIREVHHRIKNDMAMVHGLLSLQSQSVASKPVRAALEEAQARVAVMKNSYRRMYQDQSVEHVRLPGFVETLVAEIEQSYGAYREVRVEREVADIAIASRAAFPFGIIINELLTNAYKYAFAEDAGARITVSVQPGEDRALRVVVSDNGIGFEESRRRNGEEPTSGESASGLNLVRELAAQYGGSVRIDDREGTVAEVTLSGVCTPSAPSPEHS